MEADTAPVLFPIPVSDQDMRDEILVGLGTTRLMG